MDSKRGYPILGLVVIILVAGGYWYLSNQSVNTYEVIFRIGKENGSPAEFNYRGFEDQLSYTCTMGADFSNKTFPKRLLGSNFTDANSYLGVENIEIIFTLEHNYRNIIFRLVRSGSETTTVVVDDEHEYLVTAEMLGSSDNGGFGSYNLELGELNQGTHSIILTVADDGNGNGAYWWDALSLYNSPT